MMLKQGWWKTPDGRLVPDGHPDAAVLAYPRYSEIPDATAQQLGIPADAAVPQEAAQAGDVDQAEELRAELVAAQSENEALRAELEAVRQTLSERDAELAEVKAAPKPADKARAKPADKARA